MSAPGATRNSDNFCYRHPDRQSFVLCQRCLRTICAECQTPAAVGVICPECMRDQQRAQTPAQRTAQRRWGARGAGSLAAVRGGRPLVTYWLIGITVAVYVLQLIPALNLTSWLLFAGPYVDPTSLINAPFQPWRLLTAAFVHSIGSFWHILLNMLALWMLGRTLEPLLGRVRFLALYLISALGGSVAVALIAPYQPVVGASGAVFGLLGALLVIGRHLGANLTGIVIVLGINLLIGFIPGFQIAWQAHLGGLAIGALIGFIYARTRRREQRGAQIGLVALTVAGLLALLLVPVLT
ncbi:MAG TPA: rhomboid family intramembrane serine protease [Microbacteriaceae bacterium]|nr:rhomboid family intramembrane serine protease [Microbacteriaceae bacterium]HPZ35045.1 rhomboid family intramembrane serine protease [Microbacteriaceae bacterium]HQC93573.1 rhomboid family intramembrane serine protease [Microbacteriaceae bacterium]